MCLDQKKKLQQLKIEYVEISRIFIKISRNKTLSVKEYLNKNRPYLKDPKKSHKWKIQLTIPYNFISSI